MAAQLQFLVEGKTDSPAGQSRHDLEAGKLVTIKNVSPGASNTLEVLWMAHGDTAAVSMDGSGAPAQWTFRPTAGAVGTYRVKLTVDGVSTIREAAILTPNRQLRIPALGERASLEASWATRALPEVVAASENNATYPGDPRIPGANYAGHYPDLEKLFLVVDGLAGTVDALPSGGASSSNDIANDSGVSGGAGTVSAALDALQAGISAAGLPTAALSGRLTLAGDMNDGALANGMAGTINTVNTITVQAVTGPANLTGLASPTVEVLDRFITMVNIGTNNITLKHQSSGSASGNQFMLPGATDLVLKPNASIILRKGGMGGPWAAQALTGNAPVLSVLGRTGAVAAAQDDYLASQVKNDSGFGGATVATALNALNAKAIPAGSNDLANQSTVPGGGTVTTALNALQTAVAGAGGGNLLTINNQTGTTYTFTLADGDNKTIVSGNNAAAQVYTIPSNAAVPMPIGSVVAIEQAGTGQISLAIASDSLGTPGLVLKTRVRNSIIYATKMAATRWTASGDLA